jgi:hypothetical protein
MDSARSLEIIRELKETGIGIFVQRQYNFVMNYMQIQPNSNY